MHPIKSSNQFISENYNRVSLISAECIGTIIRANDYLLKCKGMSRKHQGRELKLRGLIIVENTYYALKRGSYNRISTMFLSILCSYWNLTLIDMLLIGRELNNSDTPDLTRCGMVLPKNN